MQRVCPSPPTAEAVVAAIPRAGRLLPLTALNKRVDETPTPCKAPGVDWRAYFSDLGEQTSSERVREEARDEARALCRGCQVPLYCLERSLRFGRDQWGVAGGLPNLDREEVYELWAATYPTFDELSGHESSGDEDERREGNGSETDAADAGSTGADSTGTPSTSLARQRGARDAQVGGDRDAAA